MVSSKGDKRTPALCKENYLDLPALNSQLHHIQVFGRTQIASHLTLVVPPVHFFFLKVTRIKKYHSLDCPLL